jgi:3-polyprenyl-4-hydroxybenzoate decarboxylase
MSYHDLRDFITQLEQSGRSAPQSHRAVSPYLEMTALCDRVSARQRPGHPV